GFAGGLVGTAVAAPLSIALAVGIGGKMLRDERGRQLTARRAQARHAVQRYLFDEVRPSMGKQVRDTLRTVQRSLRDEFALRASTMHQSTVRAVRAVERVAAASPDERAARAVQVHDQSEKLRRLARQLVPGSTPARGTETSDPSGPRTRTQR